MEMLSPAKINLFLQIKGKRADGYHDIHSLFCPVSLYDRVSVRPVAGGTSVSCPHPDVPEDETNLACRAAALFFQDRKIDSGAKITLDKKIPVAAGLGGGSSNAAAVMKALNRHFGSPLDSGGLMALGASLGADVPFFILGKPALASGIGTELSPYTRLKPLQILLVNPGIALSTAEVYKNFDFGLTKGEKKFINFDFDMDFDADTHLRNDLESVAVSRCDDIDRIKEALLNHGAIGASMSGSGPTVFGIFQDIETARAAKHGLSEHAGWKVFLAKTIV